MNEIDAIRKTIVQYKFIETYYALADGFGDFEIQFSNEIDSVRIIRDRGQLFCDILYNNEWIEINSNNRKNIQDNTLKLLDELGFNF